MQSAVNLLVFYGGVAKLIYEFQSNLLKNNFIVIEIQSVGLF